MHACMTGAIDAIHAVGGEDYDDIGDNSHRRRDNFYYRSLFGETAT